ncbi:MAG: ferritin [Armatimonadetes bacterium]|nr:ferritin [Armatimonadota bacterium]
MKSRALRFRIGLKLVKQAQDFTTAGRIELPIFDPALLPQWRKPYMLISQQMNDRLNDQINFEQYSSHTYLAMSAAFEKMGLKVFADYYRKHADEEREHAMKMFDYVVDAGGTVVIKAIDEPKGDWNSVEKIVQQTLEHEILVTKRINDLVELAEQEKDYATRSFLQWYVDEQVEEVSTAEQLLTLVKMAGDNILYLEHRISQMA